MEGFLLDENGDVVIKDRRIQMTSGNELLLQKVRQVLLTNNGEWWLNAAEGIDRYALLCKKPNYDLIKDNIKQGLLQVDETFKIISFSCTPQADRELLVKFTAANENGDEILITL